MSTQVDPVHNLSSLEIATAEFHFSSGATSAADSLLKGFRFLGNLVDAGVEVDNKREEHKGAYRGVRRNDKIIVTDSKLSWKLKTDEATYENLKLLVGGSDLSTQLQAIGTLQAMDTIVFTAGTPGVIGNRYDITLSSARKIKMTTAVVAKGPQVAVTADNTTDLITETTHTKIAGDAVVFTEGTMPTGLTAGTVYYVVTPLTNTYGLALTVGGAAINFSSNGSGLKINLAMIEGTDMDLDLLLGSFVLKTAQTVTMYIYATYPAITSSDYDYFRTIQPLQNPSQSGYGQLLIYDQDEHNKVVARYVDFSCDVAVDSASSFDGQKWFEITLNVDVTKDVGSLWVRRANFTPPPYT